MFEVQEEEIGIFAILSKLVLYLYPTKTMLDDFNAPETTFVSAEGPRRWKLEIGATSTGVPNS